MFDIHYFANAYDTPIARESQQDTLHFVGIVEKSLAPHAGAGWPTVCSVQVSGISTEAPG